MTSELKACVDELLKLGAVSDEHAQKSLDRLDALERNRPSVGQLGRYGAIGAVAAPAIGAIGNVIRKRSPFEGATAGAKFRDAASMAVRGGLGASVIPVARTHSDRRAEVGTLKKYVAEHEPGVPAPKAAGVNPAVRPKVKAGDALPDGVMSYNPGDFKPVRFTKRGAALTPAGMLAHSRAVGMPKLTAPPGPSIAQIAKPKGAGFGTGIAGAFKGTIGGTAGTGYK